MDVTLPVALLMSAASTLAGVAGTWAVLRYKVDRAMSTASAAHRRLDALEPVVTRHQVLHEHHDRRLGEAYEALTRAMDHLREDLEKAIAQLGDKLDAMQERELRRATGQQG